MKKTLFPRLAANGIRKNRKLYRPYILACSGMTTLVYILAFLGNSEMVNEMSAGSTLSIIMRLGSWILAIFSCIFLFYTNSFLIRRRKREFGLYNILGMGKHSIARIVIWESMMVFAVSQICGLAFGIAFSKLAELGLTQMVHGTVYYTVTVSTGALLQEICSFAVIHLLILVNTVRQLTFSSPVELMRSENVGEKPPKANPVLGIGGAILMSAAYWLAQTIIDPYSAMSYFFVAVIMVIIATYMLFTAGSVLLCRMLQKNTKYYYKPSHFVSVSSMAYRMKRNGAGLASICILATMVLVTVSSTVSLYFGVEDTLKNRYPRDIGVTVKFENLAGFGDGIVEELHDALSDIAEEKVLKSHNRLEILAFSLQGLFKDCRLDLSDYYKLPIKQRTYLQFIPLSHYNRITGNTTTLENGNIITCGKQNIDSDHISISCDEKDLRLNIVKHEDHFIEEASALFGEGTYVAVIRDDDPAVSELLSYRTAYDTAQCASGSYYFGFNTDADSKTQIDIHRSIYDSLMALAAKTNCNDPNETSFTGYSIQSIADDRADFYASYGGLLFLGIMLSIAFSAAAAMIIYYKQLSEGYEDRARFGIMQKVGMKKSDIKKSVNSQMLTVFFMPLAVSGIHMLFAFHMIELMLNAFGLINPGLFLITTIISFTVFALFYTVVYKVTANSYYSIVSV